ncbi:hypothetical protein M3205_03305 [Cytobacillus firmus]|uniref:hypothetical protein n=1 Tax=Cytobacillus firmus TaxID=1399 RepID=UPI00203B2EB0|nr:hypothetical protein [Cytobacillus firmus]MCM3704744.1 hypothetical protein [Cytobacillus firmus]
MSQKWSQVLPQNRGDQLFESEVFPGSATNRGDQLFESEVVPGSATKQGRSSV